MQEEIIRRVQTTITDAQVKVEVDGNRAPDVVFDEISSMLGAP